MNTLFTIWVIISLFIMPIVYITLSIKMRKTLERKYKGADTFEELFSKVNQLLNNMHKLYESIDEQQITLEFICNNLKNIKDTQNNDRAQDQLNQVLEHIKSIKADNRVKEQLDKVLESINQLQENNKTQEQLDKVLESINQLQEDNKCQDYVRLYNMLASIKAGNKDIVSAVTKIKTAKTIKNQLYDTSYQNEILLDDIDVLERKYEKQQYEYMNLLEAAKVLCEYYEQTKNEQSKHIIIDSKDNKENNEADDAMKRLNELIKKLYKIKEEQ